jgi:hypothetical protein
MKMANRAYPEAYVQEITLRAISSLKNYRDNSLNYHYEQYVKEYSGNFINFLGLLLGIKVHTKEQFHKLCLQEENMTTEASECYTKLLKVCKVDLPGLCRVLTLCSAQNSSNEQIYLSSDDLHLIRKYGGDV